MLQVVGVDAPVLSRSARTVTEFDDGLGDLVGQLFARMLADGWPALVAPHLGISARVIVYCIEGQQGYVVNPIVEHVDGELMAQDVCPSLTDPDTVHISRRPMTIVVSGVDTENRPTLVRAIGAGAHALHHGLDHLDGRTHREDDVDGE